MSTQCTRPVHWVTPGLAGIASRVLGEKLSGREVAEGLIRPGGIVGVLPLACVLVERCGRPGEIVDFVKFLGMRALS